ncbi:MAG TPA: C40 family peptidase [Polyangiaceae bacterium]|nr:C40 family peptidase [Polyangiaceae bacterium]
MLRAEAGVIVLVNLGLADLMTEPSVSSERASQVLLGEAATLLTRGDDWVELRLERDGYVGWVRAVAILECGAERARAYRAACGTVVTAEIAPAFLEAERRSNAGKLPFGVRLPLVERRGDTVALELPDGRTWWVAASDTTLAAELPRPDAGGIAAALAWMRRSVGVPYLWGGCSPFGYDCSGLTQAFWATLGVRIPRDADQQFRAGEPVEGSTRAGDLLFFSSNATPGERARHADIRHVAIALGGDQILHASGRMRTVTVDLLAPGRSAHGDWLLQNSAGARRYACS